MRLHFILLCLPLLALDNSVTIRDAAGTSQTARPTTIYRSFAQGEFASGTYPKPRIGGSVPSVWQVDVKTAWPDGSVMAAYISFRLGLTANGSAVVDFVSDANPCHLGNLATCQAAALTQAGMLNYDTGTGVGSWGATWYGTVNSIGYSAAVRTMLTAGAWRYALRGPVATGVIVEDRSSALSFDFGWQYTGGAWAAPSTNYFKSLHPVFEVRFYPDPDGAGSLTGWGGVEVDAQIWNASISRFQRINTLALELRTGNPDSTSAYSVTNKSFHARSRRHKLVWSGTAPGDVVVDYNFPYLIHTKLIPPYNYSLGVSTALADGTISAYNSRLGSDEPQWCDASSSFCGSWQKAVGGTGARGDIGLTPQWYLYYLYLMGNNGVTTAKKKEMWDKLVIGNADASGHAPIHYMEAFRTGQYFPAGGTTTGMGLPISINLYQLPAYGSQEEQWGGTPATFTCSSAPCDGRLNATVNPYKGSWIAEGVTDYTSHAPSLYSIPAFLTGYHYYITGAQFEAAFALATSTMGTGIGGRHNRRGIIYDPGVIRATAWTLRNIAWATILTPDGDIEKAYFKDKLKNNAAFQEGIMMIPAAASTPANPLCPSYVGGDAASDTADMWCAGRNTWTLGFGSTPATNPIFVPVYAYPQTSGSDQIVNGHRRAPGFMVSYIAASLAWIAGTGAIVDVDNQPIFKHARNGLAAHFAGRVLTSPTSMGLMRALDWAWGPATKAFCTTFAECNASYITTWPLAADMTNAQTTLIVTGTDMMFDYGWFNTSWAKIDNEFVRLTGDPAFNTPSAGQTRITISQRGVWGSTATTHTAGATVTWLPSFWDVFTYEYLGGYPVLARAALALLADADQIGEYSPRQAYDVFSSALPFQNYQNNPHWAVAPGERIGNVQAVSGSRAATLRWTAPAGETCRVYLGLSPPPASSDAADPLAEAPGRVQRFESSGLEPGMHYYRISCGTGRASGTLQVTP